MLTLANNLKLPLEAVTGTFAILAIRGVGKTHTASVMAEEMLKAGQPIVAYDPTGAWWGLKSSADGKRPGFPVVIFGGEHADVPLEETAGDTIASTIVDKRIPAILDCSLMRKGARVRFMTSFCETLYHKNREALHLFLDEAHTVAPQNIRAMPEASRLLGAVEDIILQGRRRGLGLTAISPRPAIVNTSVRSACQTLIAMRIVGVHDRKAVDEWIEAHGDPVKAKEMYSSLAALPKGDGWVWNPAEGVFKLVHFRERETFDSSATPKVGCKVITPQRMAKVDLAALGDAIRATVERAKQDDPAELRKEIARLKREKGQAVHDPKAIEAAEQRGEARGRKAVQAELQQAQKLIRDREGRLSKIESLAHLNGAATADLSSRNIPRTSSQPIERKPVERPAGKTGGKHATDYSEPTGDLTGPEQRILNAIAWLESLGIDAPQQVAVAFLAGYSVGGGAFNNPRGSLNTKGLVQYVPGGRIKLTEAGTSLADLPDVALTTDELQARVMEKLPGPERKILQVLLEIYPDDIGNDELAERSGYSQGGGAFNNPRGRLRSLGLVDYPSPGRVVACPVLFLEGVR